MATIDHNMSNIHVKAGYTLASKLDEADIKAGNTKRKLLLSVISKYNKKEEIDFVVTGFEMYHVELGASPQTIAVRKSEILAVFKAALRGEDNIKKLADFTGSYHAWLTFARSLKGKRSEDNPQTARKPRVRRLTDKGAARVKVTLQAANDEQVINLVSDITQSLVDKEEGQAYKPILMVIQGQAEVLARTKSFSKDIQSLGHKILEIVVPALQEEVSEEKIKQVA
jgi:hypothetical protein